MAAAKMLFSFRNARVLSKLSKNTLTKLVGVRKASQLSYHDALTLPDSKMTTLGNRLRVVTEESSSDSATVGLWIDVGSRYEGEENNGATHLLEHLLFQGTPELTQQNLEAELTELGIQLSSHLSRDHLAIYAKCVSQNVMPAVKILSQLVKNSDFQESNINNGKSALITGLREASTDLSVVAMDYLHATAYQGTTLGRSIYGTTESIENLSQKEMKLFKNKYVNPPRIVLAGAGGIEHEDLVNYGKTYFGDMEALYGDGIPVIPPSRFTGSEIRARYDDEPFAHIAMAVEGPGVASEDNIPLMVASSIIGNWDKTYAGGKFLSSHLASASASAGLSESFRSFNISYHGTGLWGAYFVCDKMQIDDFIYNLQGEWMRICTSATEFEVERAKNAIRTALFGNIGDTTITCDSIAKQALFLGRRVSYNEIENRLNSIDATVVRNVAFKYIYDKCPAIASYGPTEQVPDYNRIRGAMYWLRY